MTTQEEQLRRDVFYTVFDAFQLVSAQARGERGLDHDSLDAKVHRLTDAIMAHCSAFLRSSVERQTQETEDEKATRGDGSCRPEGRGLPQRASE